MSTNFLSFLSGASVEEVKGSTRRGGGGRAKQWNPAPTLLAIRVWKDGSVFPSQAAVDMFDLEYRKAVITKEPIKKEGKEVTDDEGKVKMKNVYEFPDGTGNGFDVIDSRVWAGYKAAGHMLFIAAVPKDAGKVDMFQSTNYLDDGTPKTNVLEQGSITFGRTVLIPAIEELYGITFHKPAKEEVQADTEKGIEYQAATEEVPGVEFVDMVIIDKVGDVNIVEKFSTGFTHVPKRVIRGEEKGKPDYIRREGLKVYGFVPASILGIASTEDNATERLVESEEEQQSQGEDDNVIEVTKLPIEFPAGTGDDE